MKVERIEVKRCFVASEKGKRLRGKGMDAFESGFKEIEREVSGISESSLNNEISPDSPRRLHDYNRLTWYFEECSVDDLGVWPKAGLSIRPKTKMEMEWLSNKFGRRQCKYCSLVFLLFVV
jgi:hypothetical protein